MGDGYLLPSADAVSLLAPFQRTVHLLLGQFGPLMIFTTLATTNPDFVRVCPKPLLPL
jgi:hypothetical protein